MPFWTAVAAVLGLCRAVCGHVAALPAVRAQLGQSSHGSYRFGQFAGHLNRHGLFGWVRVVVASEVDQDLLEDGLVEPLPLLAHGFAVELASIAEQQKHQFKVLAHEFHVLLAGRNQAVGIMYLSQHRGLPEFEVFYRDGFIKVGVDQLLLLALQLYQALPLVGEQGLVLFLPSIQAGSGQLAHFLDGLLGELHLGLPDALNFLLDLLHRNVRQVAICPAGVSPKAEEVAVDTTLAPGVAIAHASAAASAEQRALQVVGVPPGTVAGDASPSQNFLHLVPGLVINKGFVGTVVNEFSVPNLAHVVRVGEHAVDLAIVQGRADVLDGGAAFETSFLELISQGRDTPVSTGVGPKGPADMLGFLFVKGDPFDFMSLDACQRVYIPDWCHPMRAAPHGFLGDSLLGLARQVAGVELGHTGENVVHQHACWGFIYLLAHRDQGGASSLDLGEDHDVVCPVSGQPVELVHDDIVHTAFGHIGEQRLQTGSICRAGRSTGIDKLTHDFTAEVGHFSLTGRALRRDGIALGLAVSGGLARG